MPARNLERFRARPLRVVLSCAVRGANRVLPLTRENEPRVSQLVGLSHSFAAGAQIEPIELEEALNALRAESREDGISPSTKAALSSVEQLNASTMYAARILMIADQSPHLLGRALEEGRRPAFEAAAGSFAAAWDATEAQEVGIIISPKDAQIATDAFESDLQTLRAFPEIEDENWLGLPVNAGDQGLFGELWPKGVAPEWYGTAGPKFTIVPAEYITDAHTAGEADVICWNVSGPSSATPEEVKKSMAAIAHESSLNGRLPPVFIVYAHGLDDRTTGELISQVSGRL